MGTDYTRFTRALKETGAGPLRCRPQQLLPRTPWGRLQTTWKSEHFGALWDTGRSNVLAVALGDAQDTEWAFRLLRPLSTVFLTSAGHRLGLLITLQWTL